MDDLFFKPKKKLSILTFYLIVSLIKPSSSKILLLICGGLRDKKMALSIKPVHI
jgi:hypothetical protein